MMNLELFPSLEAFKEAHRHLLQRYRIGGKLDPDLLEEVKRLLKMGSETGQVLDNLSDQRTAQGILDYWSAILHRGFIDAPEAVLAPFDPSTESQLSDGDYPYVRSGRIGDSESGLLFGRDSLIREMLDRLRDDNFLAVIGPLGSGRSSLVQAGLLPALARGELPGSETWPVYQTSPLDLNELALAHDPVSVVVIDNCDYIFAGAETDEQSKFAANVLALASKPGIRRIIVLILESDYEENLSQFPDLEKRIKRAKVRVTSPTAKELYDAIERPAQRVGLKFEEGVVDEIVRDIVGERAAFVLLQFTMRQLWKRRDHNKITREALHEIGVGRTAIVRTAQRFYDGLSAKQRQLMRPLLVHLGSPMPVRLGAPPQLAAASWNSLVESSADPSEAEKLLQGLQEADLIVVREAYESGASEKTVKLAHPTLIENWEILDGWLHEERKNREHRDRLRAKAQEWVRLGRRKDAGLLSERELLEAEGWLDSPEGRLTDKNDDVWNLVEISKWRQRRQLRNSRRIAAAFAILSVALAVATLIAFWKSAEAQLQSKLARLGYIDLQILRLQLDVDSKSTRAAQLKRGAGAEREGKNIDRADETDQLAKRVLQERQTVLNDIAPLLSHIATLAADRRETVKAILSASRLLYIKPNEQQQRQLVSDALEKLHNESLTPESKLRLALYSVAAIPQNEGSLNEELQRAIAKFRLQSVFVPPGSHQVWAVAFNPVDPKQAVVGDELGIVWFWNPMDGTRGKPSRSLSAAGDIVNGLAFSPDGTKLAAAYRNSGAVVWDLATDKELCSLNRRTRRSLDRRTRSDAAGFISGANTYGVAFAPDGKTLAVGGERSVQLWDLTTTGCPPISVLQEDEVFGVAFSPTGDLLAAASGDGTVTVWELNQPDKPLRKFSISESSNRVAMYAVAFDPTDSALIAASAANGRGFLWNIETKAQTELPKGGTAGQKGGTVGQIAFSPNGKWLVATASGKGEVILADPRGGNKLDQLGGGSENPIFGIAFSPDSKFLLIGDLDGVARLWNIDANQDASGDHDALIKLGAQRMPDLNLTEDECSVLREMHIPLFALADQNFKKEEKFLCPLPFLGPRTDLSESP
jgi:WD40 repeat protein